MTTETTTTPTAARVFGACTVYIKYDNSPGFSRTLAKCCEVETVPSEYIGDRHTVVFVPKGARKERQPFFGAEVYVVEGHDTPAAPPIYGPRTVHANGVETARGRHMSSSAEWSRELLEVLGNRVAVHCPSTTYKTSNRGR